jgi:P4 family phage/plasmid primase-like protien
MQWTGATETEALDSCIAVKIGPCRFADTHGNTSILVHTDGRLQYKCFGGRCKDRLVSDLEQFFGPCPVETPADRIAKHALHIIQRDGAFIFAVDGGADYMYVDGIFTRLSAAGVKALLRPFCLQKSADENYSLTEKSWPEILHSLRQQTQTTLQGKPPQWWIRPILDEPTWQDANNVMVVGNGLLNPFAFARGETVFHAGRTPALFHQFASDVVYDPAASEMPHWQKYLADLGFDDTGIALLQEAMAVAIFPDFQTQIVILLEGQGGSGKGVAQTTAVEIAGSYAISREIEQALRGFGQQDIQGRTILSIPEADPDDTKSQRKLVSFLKRLSGKDKNSVDVKNQSFRTITHSPTPFIQSNDILDSLKDTRGALYRRLIPIFYRRQVANPDRHFQEKLRPEYPAILNWLLEGFKRRHDRGGFELPSSSKDMLESFQTTSTGLSEFVKDCLEADESNVVSTAALYSLYENWIAHTHSEVDGFQHEQVDDKRFVKALRNSISIGPKKRSTVTRQSLLSFDSDTKQVMAVTGCRVKADKLAQLDKFHKLAS